MRECKQCTTYSCFSTGCWNRYFALRHIIELHKFFWNPAAELSRSMLVFQRALGDLTAIWLSVSQASLRGLCMWMVQIGFFRAAAVGCSDGVDQASSAGPSALPYQICLASGCETCQHPHCSFQMLGLAFHVDSMKLRLSLLLCFFASLLAGSLACLAAWLLACLALPSPALPCLALPCLLACLLSCPASHYRLWMPHGQSRKCFCKVGLMKLSFILMIFSYRMMVGVDPA